MVMEVMTKLWGAAMKKLILLHIQIFPYVLCSIHPTLWVVLVYLGTLKHSCSFAAYLPALGPPNNLRTVQTSVNSKKKTKVVQRSPVKIAQSSIFFFLILPVTEVRRYMKQPKLKHADDFTFFALQFFITPRRLGRLPSTGNGCRQTQVCANGSASSKHSRMWPQTSPDVGPEVSLTVPWAGT